MVRVTDSMMEKVRDSMMEKVRDLAKVKVMHLEIQMGSWRVKVMG
jgi:hypothetical protein